MEGIQERERREESKKEKTGGKKKRKKKGKKTIDGFEKRKRRWRVQVADFFTGTDCTRAPATVSGAASRYALAKNTSDR